MNYKELCIHIKNKADQSSRILNPLLNHCLGKPTARHESEGRVIFQWCDVTQEAKPAEEESIINRG